MNLPLGAQSLLAIGAAMVLLAAVPAPLARRRRVAVLVLGFVLLAAWAFPVPFRQERRGGPFFMGDYNTYLESFDDYAASDTVRFENHLASVILRGISDAAGRGPDRPARSFRILAGLATLLYLCELLLIGVVMRWSAQAVRYIALCVAAPVMLMMWGYREFGPLALSAAAYPLALSAVAAGESADARAAGAGALSGVRAALHGFGYVNLGCLFLAFASARQRSRFRAAATLVAWGLAASLGWIVLYMLVMRLNLVPGHASGVPLRHLLDWYQLKSRDVEPLFSLKAARDLLVTGLLVGVPLCVVALVKVWRHQPVRRFFLVYTVPQLLFLLFLWPVQGVAMELDLLFAAFPAYFAAAWHTSEDPRAVRLALALVAVGHLVVWYVGGSEWFVNPRVV